VRRRVGILISGRGSNMAALIAAARAPDYPAEIACVVSNRPEAPGLALAEEAGIEAVALDHRAFDGRAAFDRAMHKALIARGVGIIACAGFMRLMSEDFVNAWAGRMINIHPSLLPLFKGLDTHARALEAGVRVHGCTVHFVTPELDSGPIIAQAVVPVLPDDDTDTLAARVLTAEHRLYPAALALVASGKASLRGKGVKLEATTDGLQRLWSPDLAQTHG
jgi:phosphoribosylglycinamide formyltransferase-1